MTPGGGGDTPRFAQREGEATKVTGHPGRQGRREGRGGAPKEVGPGEGASTGDSRSGTSVGTRRMGESGHVGAGGHVRPEGVGVT